ncbi:MAG: efflux RND transporter periplasmic adaptor subunit [Synergistaceae bacterium]|jgi:RND family efflux transporter MFP subunit|nr:efflux RND transporter periplasmic adaptor subunit [Synergistaceae bacterium]
MKKAANGNRSRAFFVILILLFAAVAGAIAFFTNWRGGETAGASSEPEEQAPFVKVITASSNSTVRESIVQNMSIEAVNRVKMTPRVTGRLEKLHVKQGDKVKSGQLIAVLEHAQQDALISSTQAQLASAQADTQRAKAEMMNAKTNLDRYERLVKEGFSTQQQFDTYETAYVSSRANYDAAIAKERQAVSELGRVKSSRQDYIMYSPLDGTVLSDYSLTQGEMISQNSPIVDIADLRRLKASLRIPENKIFIVQPGMDVFLKFDALPDEEFRGKVTRIDPYVDTATRTSAVEIELDNEAVGNRLRPGMFGQASIIEREFPGSVLLPESALGSDSEGYFVFIEDNGAARRRDVHTGVRQGDSVHVTDGVVSGDRVIVFGGNNLSDGERVEVQ